MFAMHKRSSHGSKCRAAREKWRRRLRGGGDSNDGIMAGPEVFRIACPALLVACGVDAGRTVRSTAKE